MSNKIKRMVSIMLTFALVLCASAINPVAVNAAGAGEKVLKLTKFHKFLPDTCNKNAAATLRHKRLVVETKRIELSTSRMRTERSPS